MFSDTDIAGAFSEKTCPAAAEIAGMAGKGGLMKNLDALGMLPPGAAAVRIVCDEDRWKRGGGESYILPFAVCAEDAAGGALPSRRYILKACVKMASPDDPEGPSRRLLERRRHLEDGGIAVPALKGYRKGVFLEEFAPESIQEAFTEDRAGTLEKAAAVYGVLARLGYRPAHHFLADLRRDGENLVCIDFGDDLGAPRPEDPACLWDGFAKEAAAFLGASGDEIEKCRSAYDRASAQNGLGPGMRGRAAACGASPSLS